MFLASLNTEIIKYTVVVLSAPVWWPFLKALYAELNDALREEGGLLGSAPTAKELERINRDQGPYQSPLVSQDHDDRGPNRPGPARAGRSAPAAGRSGAQGQGTRAPAPAKGGFSKPRSARGFSRKDQR